jgi:hypothetical protein
VIEALDLLLPRSATSLQLSKAFVCAAFADLPVLETVLESGIWISNVLWIYHIEYLVVLVKGGVHGGLSDVKIATAEPRPVVSRRRELTSA